MKRILIRSAVGIFGLTSVHASFEDSVNIFMEPTTPERTILVHATHPCEEKKSCTGIFQCFEETKDRKFCLYNTASNKQHLENCIEEVCSNCTNSEDLLESEYESAYYCFCKGDITGKMGKNCEKDTPCSSSPCSNGGVCTDTYSTFDCACPSGYMGKTCTDIIQNNFCDSSPCLNGATCNEGVTGYKCICASGYTGGTCSTLIKDCDSNPCLNGATCKEGGAGYTCSCTNGYTGETCSTLIEDCDPSPCLDGAMCNDIVGFFTCNCSFCDRFVSCKKYICGCNESYSGNGSTCEVSITNQDKSDVKLIVLIAAIAGSSVLACVVAIYWYVKHCKGIKNEEKFEFSKVRLRTETGSSAASKQTNFYESNTTSGRSISSHITPSLMPTTLEVTNNKFCSKGFM